MRRGTKIGWLLIAVSIMLSVWVIISTSAVADSGGYTVDGTTLKGIPSGVEHVEIPSNVTAIAPDLFKNNTTITSVNIPDSVTDLGTGFNGCTGLQSVTIGTGITTIGSDIFYNCTSLNAVNFPSTLTTIGANAFRGCTGLKTVSIPAGCTSVHPDAFNGCVAMVGFTGGSSAYSISADNCLYSADGTTLVNVPDGKTSITIPSNCKAIADGAFNGSSVSSLTIPSTVTSIGTQSDWTPEEIWGDEGSEACNYAKANDDITFRTISGNNGGGSETAYSITAGANQTYTKGSGNALSITGDGDYADFSAVQMDGSEIASDYYSVASGSTIVTLNASYLETLSNGNHTFTIIWNDGTASTGLRIASANNSGENGGNGESGNNGNNGSNNGNGNNSGSNATGYTITSGANSTWTKGSGTTLSFTGSGPMSEFAGIKVDGTTVGASNYSATTSPTILTLSNQYLESLSVGNHSLTVVWTGGTATANFNVAAAGTGSTSKTTTTTTTKTSTGTGTTHAKDNTPKTADGKLDPRYFLAFAIMLSGIAIVINGRGKQINYVNNKRNQ